jgi:hypothetical protein
MPFERLAEATQTLYAELLDQAVQAEAEEVARRLPPKGSFVSKTIKGQVYWYLQRMEAGRKAQYYIGVDSPQLRRWMSASASARKETRSDELRRTELAAMLAAGGAARPDGATARVLRTLREVGVFRLGGVLVGTQAFFCYANLLGIKFEGDLLRTQDIDLVHDPSVMVGIDRDFVPTDIAAALSEADPGFFAVPALDRTKPSTSFKVRGRDVRVDLLTPARGGSTEPVILRYLKAAAQPLPFLGYLLEGYLPAVIPTAYGLLVNVAEPARYAWHKLWTAAQRPSTEHVKSLKDIRQANQLFEVLEQDRPGDLEKAWKAVEDPRKQRRIMRAAESQFTGIALEVAKRIGSA